jgi:hypothetical protein
MSCHPLCAVGTLFLLCCTWIRSQEALVQIAPFSFPTVRQEGTAGSVVLPRLAASRALELGFPSIAVEILRKEIASLPPESTQERNRLVVDLSTALLDDGRPVEAEEVLALYVGLPTSEFRLRVAMAAVRLKKVENARNEVSAIRTGGAQFDGSRMVLFCPGANGRPSR